MFGIELWPGRRYFVALPPEEALSYARQFLMGNRFEDAPHHDINVALTKHGLAGQGWQGVYLQRGKDHGGCFDGCLTEMFPFVLLLSLIGKTLFKNAHYRIRVAVVARAMPDGSGSELCFCIIEKDHPADGYLHVDPVQMALGFFDELGQSFTQAGIPYHGPDPFPYKERPKENPFSRENVALLSGALARQSVKRFIPRRGN